MPLQTISIETRGPVGIITFARPQAFHAVCALMLEEVAGAVDAFEKDKSVRVVVMTGNERAFSAGTDLQELSDKSFYSQYTDIFTPSRVERIAGCKKPLVAAVAGYVLGGGCELAMLADIIIAADNARFGFPEITAGLLPGLGGIQRLVKAVGKSKAMEMVLTGRSMGAEEAERAGLVSRVVPMNELMDDVLKMADRIAVLPAVSIMLSKKAVQAGLEMNLREGLEIERLLYDVSFATHDTVEGVQAFIEKRPPSFKHE